MKRIAGYLLGLVLALLMGCAAPPRTYTPAASMSSSAVPAVSTVMHDYLVKAVDVTGAPLEGVTVALSAKSEHTSSTQSSCVTDTQGMCPVFRFEVKRDPTLTYVKSYMSNFTAEGEKLGYYSRKGTGFSAYGSSTSATKDAVQTVTLRMVKPVDYLDDSLLNSAADKELRGRVLMFLDVIRAQSILNDAEVVLKGIGVSDFKGRKYLRVKVNSTTTYNTLKLDKYAIGKTLFDDTVRKLLNPLNEAISAPKAFYGYDLLVYGHSKSFGDKYAVSTRTEYRYLMPEAAVRRYKDKDISGQALLDASVLLLDDERIELKLQ